MKLKKANKSKVWLMAMILLVVVAIAIVTILTPRTYASTTEDGLFNYTVNYDNTVTITGCNNIGITDITIPSTIDGYQVTSIATGTFSASSAVTVYIPSSILNIEDEAFQLCNSLVSINVDEQNSKYSSEDGILFDKDKSKIIRYPQVKEGNSYIIPDSVVSVEAGAFYKCTSLKNIEIPKNVTNIGKKAFKSCNIESLNLPEGITEISTSAFESCIALTSISIPNTVTNIGNNAFAWCQDLNKVILSDQIVSIGSNAFFSCDITSLVIPCSVETIDFDAFACNYNLTYAVMPNSLEEIGNSIFRGSDSSFKIYLIKDSYAESYASEKSYSYEYLNLNQINIEEPPIRTIYNVGENFSDDGMVVNAVYSYEDSKTIEYKISPDDYIISPSESLAFGTTEVTVSYEHNGVSKTANQSIEVKDNIEPTINSVTGNVAEWTKEDVTLTISATDNESGIAEYSFDDGENWQTANSKTYTANTSDIKIKVKDNAGNITSYEETLYIDKIDKTAPTITISPNGVTTSQSQNVTITVEDNGGSGLNSNNSYQYQLGTSSTVVPTGTWQDYTSGTEFTIGEGLTGNYYLWIKTIEDNAGNQSAEAEYVVSNLFTFENTKDTTAPTISSVTGNATEWTKEDVTLTINAIDNESGIAEYSFDDGENWQTANRKTYTANTSDIKIKVKDNAGNIASYEETLDIDKIDKTAPTITITPNGSSTTQNKNITITVADVGGSGLSNNNSYQYQLGTSSTVVPTGTWQDYTSGTEFTIGEGLTGDYYIWIKNISDNAENGATETDYIVSNKFTFDNNEEADTIAPELSIEYSTTQLTNKSVTATIKSNEEIQEVDGWTISEDNKTLTKVYTKNTTEDIDVYDISGNKSTIQVKITNIDTTKPELSVEYDITQLTNKSVTATITANEQLQQLEGWTISEDCTTLTKIYTENTEESIEIYDLAGNKATIQVKIANIDKTEIQATVEYSTTILTNKNVTVKIILNKEIQEINGWTLSDDKMTLTKEYTENADENVKIQDFVGNEREIKISVQNIDKLAPTVKVKYSTTQKTNEDVIVTIVSDEQLQEVDGWTISEDGKTLTKKYEKNSEETVKVYDIAGNEIEVKVSVNNIDKTTTQENEENGGESSETPDTAPTRLPDAGKKTLIGVIIITIIVAIVLWTKNRNYKDIK